jgi:hypothetical protein
VTVDDIVPATIEEAVQAPSDPASDTVVVKLVFSEEVDRASAENVSNYWPFEGNSFLPVNSAKLAEDGKTVTLIYAKTAQPLNFLKVKGVADMGGLTCDLKVPITQLKPVFELNNVSSFDGKGRGFLQAGVAKLPTKGTSSWTINLFVKVAKQPEHLTTIAGFGDGQDNSGEERFLIANNGHIYFWGSNIDIDGGVPYDLNRWQMVTITYDGKTIRIFKDGKEIKSENASLNDAEAEVRIGRTPPWDDGHRFQGQIGGMTIWNEALPPAFIERMVAGAPNP